jgi:hypothetical protein
MQILRRKEIFYSKKKNTKKKKKKKKKRQFKYLIYAVAEPDGGKLIYDINKATHTIFC